MERGWSRQALGKYVALQIPSAALAGVALWVLWGYGVIPAWLAWCILLLWIAKDVLLFFYLWPAYEPNTDTGPFSPLGLVGEAGHMKRGRIRVRVRGELWQARPEPGSGPIRPGQRVRVVDWQGLLLTVRPEPGGSSASGGEHGQ